MVWNQPFRRCRDRSCWARASPAMRLSRSGCRTWQSGRWRSRCGPARGDRLRSPSSRRRSAVFGKIVIINYKRKEQTDSSVSSIPTVVSARACSSSLSSLLISWSGNACWGRATPFAWFISAISSNFPLNSSIAQTNKTVSSLLARTKSVSVIIWKKHGECDKDMSRDNGMVLFRPSKSYK